MHRELKGEATRPPGMNLQAQQRKLNKFIYEYNEVRPYRVLGKRTAGSVHEISEREYPERIRDWVEMASSFTPLTERKSIPPW